MKAARMALVVLFALTTVAVVCAKTADTQAAKADLATVVKGNNDFALDLYARLTREEGGPLHLGHYPQGARGR